MTPTRRKKSFVRWVNHEWTYDFKLVEHRAGGFNILQYPDDRERELGFADTKVRITIEELD